MLRRSGRDDLVGQSTTTMSIIILIFVLCHMPRLVTGFEPGFISPLENITVAAGRSAQFTCVVKHLGGHKVAWLRSDSKAILAIHTHMVTNNPRMSVSHNGHNSWTLTIDIVQRNDSGLYMCQINTEPMTSQVGVLNVVEAPDILYNETSNDTIVAEGASVTLRCEARGYPEPIVTWRREDGAPIVLRNHQTPIRIQTVEGNDLELQGITRSDMGPYLCIASNGIPSPVSKRIMLHVHFHPLIKVHDQLVITRLGSKVSLQCSVEASPKAVHFWIKKGNRPGDEEISINNPNGRYRLTEEHESLYSYKVALTINRVARTDLGNYTCGARNSYGTVRGTISLKKLKEPTIQPTTTEMFEETQSNYDKKHRKKENRKKYWEQKNEKNNNNDLYVASTKKSTGYYYDVTPPTYSYQNFYDSENKKQNSETSSKDNSGSFFSNGGKSQIFVTYISFFVILICQIVLVQL